MAECIKLADFDLKKAVALSSSYLVTASGFYWLAVQVDNGIMAFTVSVTFRADSIKRREETTGGFALPATAGRWMLNIIMS